MLVLGRDIVWYDGRLAIAVGDASPFRNSVCITTPGVPRAPYRPPPQAFDAQRFVPTQLPTKPVARSFVPRPRVPAELGNFPLHVRDIRAELGNIFHVLFGRPAYLGARDRLKPRSRPRRPRERSYMFQPYKFIPEIFGKMPAKKAVS